MARGYWRVQRYQVFYGEGNSVYASTEKQAVKLAKKLNGRAVECDGDVQIYPKQVMPKENCETCHGEGFVSGDWVDYGSTKTQLPDEYCDCILEQLPEDYDGKIEVNQHKNK